MNKYFEDCTISEMFEYKDWYYERSDDHRAYMNGRAQDKLIQAKVEELGGWNAEILEAHNKYAPKDFQMNEEWLKNHLMKQ